MATENPFHPEYLPEGYSDERPDFLRDRTTFNGRSLINEFRSLAREEATEIDHWLLCAAETGSMTAGERQLYDWINEQDELPCA